MGLVCCSLVGQSTNRSNLANLVTENLASVWKSASYGSLLQGWKPASGRYRPGFYTFESLYRSQPPSHAGSPRGDPSPLPDLTFLSESIYYFSQSGV